MYSFSCSVAPDFQFSTVSFHEQPCKNHPNELISTAKKQNLVADFINHNNFINLGRAAATVLAWHHSSSAGGGLSIQSLGWNRIWARPYSCLEGQKPNVVQLEKVYSSSLQRLESDGKLHRGEQWRGQWGETVTPQPGDTCKHSL